jgi:hypothetical protein
MNKLTSTIVAAAIVTATTLSAVTPAQARDTKTSLAACTEGDTKTVNGRKYTCYKGEWIAVIDLSSNFIAALKFFILK